ncbi:MAG TPA: four helix bundle protein [Bacteroidia bacterium]|nr:four helix bundle protein [Bacteroidia bacterium]
MKENIIKTKSYAFAMKIVKLLKVLQNQKEYILSKQLVRSATSVCANVEEGIQAQSKPDFIHEFSIAQKEVFETHYWIRLLRDSEYINEVLAQELLNDCEELQRIITSILVKSKSYQ